MCEMTYIFPTHAKDQENFEINNKSIALNVLIYHIKRKNKTGIHFKI